jgi:hypothetical protein
MGAGLIKAVYARWGALPGGPFRLLVYMALRAKDDDKPPRYWAGREDLAFGLGRVVPAPKTDDKAVQRERAAHFKAVKEAVSVLSKQGAITTEQQPRPGRAAVYVLNVSKEWGTETVPRMGDGNRAPVGDGNRAERGTETVGSGDGNRAPEEEQEAGGLREGIAGWGSPPSEGGARAHTSSAEDQLCDACGTQLDPDGSCFICRTPPRRRVRP